jgi:hypothetical protein
MLLKERVRKGCSKLWTAVQVRLRLLWCLWTLCLGSPSLLQRAFHMEVESGRSLVLLQPIPLLAPTSCSYRGITRLVGCAARYCHAASMSFLQQTLQHPAQSQSRQIQPPLSLHLEQHAGKRSAVKGRHHLRVQYQSTSPQDDHDASGSAAEDEVRVESQSRAPHHCTRRRTTRPCPCVGATVLQYLPA